MEAEPRALAAPNSWSTLLEHVVAEIRDSCGAPEADRVRLILTRHRNAGEAALDPLIADAHRHADELRAAAEQDRKEAEDLVRDVVERWSATRAEIDSHRRRMHEELEQEAEELRAAAEQSRADAHAETTTLRAEISDLVDRLDELRAPLDAREAELVEWESELRRQANSLGSGWGVARATTSGGGSGTGETAETDETAQTDEAAPAEGHHRSTWRTPRGRPGSGTGRRSWGRRPLDGGESSPPR